MQSSVPPQTPPFHPAIPESCARPAENADETVGQGATPPCTQADPRAHNFSMIGMMAIMGFIFYFLILRPQRTRQNYPVTRLQIYDVGRHVALNT